MHANTDLFATTPPRAEVVVVPAQRRSTSLTALLESQAAARPHDLAVTGPGGQLTFSLLLREARALAVRLKLLGVRPDDCVGLYVDPSLDLVIGAWGVLLAGAAYLPLSPEYPEERLRYMTSQSGCRVVVTLDRLMDKLAAIAPGCARVPARDAGSGELSERVIQPPAPTSLAYVIYTSGSTGRPKGVMIEHRSISAQMRWLRDCGHLGPSVVIMHKTPVSFDAAQWEILAPAVGSRVVIGEPGVHRDPEALIAAVTEGGVTALQCVPTLLQALLDTGRLGECTTLRRVFSGGEGLSRQLARAVTKALPDASLINLYGPTECTINATAHVVDPLALGDGPGSVSIGTPVDNTHCFILDQDMTPVGIGETGELYIGGVQLARGYLGHQDLTRERFLTSPFMPAERLYRTGDLASWNADGTIQFEGRTDNQVKLRGHRIELNEIELAIEQHPWVTRASAVVTADPRTGRQKLVACVQLDPREAALMDQNVHGAHHRSKASRLQVRSQLSNGGIRDKRDLAGLPVVDLPGKHEPAEQRRAVFARKTYRFFDGGPVTRDGLAALLARAGRDRRQPAAASSGNGLDLVSIGEVLRWFGQYRSDERLLPKYSYASPGALYAVQVYLETGGCAGLEPGLYYFHPIDHSLTRVSDRYRYEGGPDAYPPQGTVHAHFAGRRDTIEPVYQNNIREVLEMETGHMVGVFEEILPGYGLSITPVALFEAGGERLGIAERDFYLGTFAIDLAAESKNSLAAAVEVFIQAHPGVIADLPGGFYRFADGHFERVSDSIIEARHVIAINQQVYRRASFGVALVSREERAWLQYIGLGTALHRLQSNRLRIGLMQSGYSSKSGNPLPAAVRLDEILAAQGIASGPSYFAVGGAISQEQVDSEGMREDAVHMRGPAEILKDELAATLPRFMIPDRIIAVDRMPLTANGKIDRQQLGRDVAAVVETGSGAPYVGPATPAETWLASQWGKALRYEPVSVEDDFFASGGDSLIAVALVNRINREFGTRLPMQVIFESPRLADLAQRIATGTAATSSRVIALQRQGTGRPVFCWPGLGGYPMNLRPLSAALGTSRPFYGIQAHGLNSGEEPCRTIRETALGDIAEIRKIQPAGPYTLYGYSFGARVAFEAAWQLEQAGERVEALMLLCPGNPEVRRPGAADSGRAARYDNLTYLTILYSVFAGRIDGPDLERCLSTVRDEAGFTAFIHKLMPALDEPLIRRIIRIVGLTYEFDYTFHELASRRLNVPIGIIKATGDDYSFLERSSGYSAKPPMVMRLAGDHYSLLTPEGVSELAYAIRALHDF